MKRQVIAIACFVLIAAVGCRVAFGEEPNATSATHKPAQQRRGFYLHACWAYKHPFAVRTWQREDYAKMFRLLKLFGYNTVMLWPCTEALPPPLSEADRKELAWFREIVADAQKCGLETWLTFGTVVSKPEIAAKPWMQRSLWPYMETVRFDDPTKAEAYFKHRAAIIEVLNNADGYVTIDGDPGSYPGARPMEFINVFQQDRKTLDRVGTHPRKQKVIPWIWSGWGRDNTKGGFWAQPTGPHVRATLDLMPANMPEPWELLMGRSFDVGWANGRGNIEEAKRAGLLGRSTLLCYEAIEFEPSPPALNVQFAAIRRILKQEMAQAPGNLGWFGNSQTPIGVLPNAYLFARGAADPKYLDQPDEKVLADLAETLGGPAELLVPAWTCLQRGLDRLPADLPKRLRAVKLTGPAAAFLPGGPDRYIDILATQADSRIRLLTVCGKSPKTADEAAELIAEGTVALVEWWNMSRYCGLGHGTEPFQWDWNPGVQYALFKGWCDKSVSEPDKVSELAVKKIVANGTLDEQTAKVRVRELLAR
jgi:hypothetical protein